MIVDFDDISLDNVSANGMNWLYYLKGKYPNFQCNLFVIPGRSTWKWVEEINSLGWIQVCMHGWHHTDKEEVERKKLMAWTDGGFARVYKGPDWYVNKRSMDILQEEKFTLAVKEKVDHPIKQYKFGKNDFHGHIWVDGDFIELEKVITRSTNFKFIT